MKKLNSLSNKFKLSVIIPVYNQENFIENSFKSIEKLYHKDIEFIFVDDGSTDNTKNIIKKLILSKKKLNIKFYKLKKNSGPGIARNFAINKSTGNHLLFLDSDDCLVKKNLFDVIKKISKKNNYDMIFINYFKKKNLQINLCKKKLPIKSIVKLFLRTELEMCSNFYLFNKNFLLKNKIYFLKGYYEDILFMLKVFFYTKKFYIFNKKVYLKNDNPKSITNTFTKKHVIDFIKSSLDKKNFFDKKIEPKMRYIAKDCQYGLRGDYVFSNKINNKVKSKKIEKSFIINKFRKILKNNFMIKTNYDSQVMKDLFYK